MKAHILERLNAMQADNRARQTLLADLDARRVSVTNTLLRIDGAMASTEAADVARAG